MRAVVATRPAARSAQATRRDLLLETLALRHQLCVLARSNRRFRPADRLFWLFLRWLWPSWREALLLIQPATVDRWHRDGVFQCWRGRSRRRPGRPRIDQASRDLTQRMAAENCFWGAPRIHGELLKLGIAISERTVSRFLRGRLPTRSQTWRTFFANHFSGQTFVSPLMSATADEGTVVDASDVSILPVPSTNASFASLHGTSVDRRRSLQPSPFALRLSESPLQRRSGARKRNGRDPPQYRRPQPDSRCSRRPSNPSAIHGRVRLFVRGTRPDAAQSLNSVFNRVDNTDTRRANLQPERVG